MRVACVVFDFDGVLVDTNATKRRTGHPLRRADWSDRSRSPWRLAIEPGAASAPGVTPKEWARRGASR